jgi:selenocysteine lyase/cysteine desulfurase
MKRRHFFKNLGGITGGLFLKAPSLELAGEAYVREILKDDEKPVKAWDQLRKQFLLPQDYIYLNTGGLGSSPLAVIEEVKKRIEMEEINPNAGHSLDDWWQIKQKCQKLLGGGCEKEELALISTATEGINIIINGLPLKKEDEIITSTHEHVALNIPLLYKQKTGGVVIKRFEPDLENGLNNVDKIRRLITKRTKLIFISHITCTTGQILPLKEIGELAKSKGIMYAVDGAQALAHLPFDMGKINADFYTASCHKWLLGPKRTGLLYVKKNQMNTLKPIITGAYSVGYYDKNHVQLEFDSTAQRYEFGTQNEALFYGVGKAVDFINNIGTSRIWEHNKHLSEKFYLGLKKIPGIHILSPKEEKYRSSMITFRVKNRNQVQIASELKKDRYRLRFVDEANLNGIRASFHLYNSNDQVASVLTKIKRMAERS